ncbi:MAG TPA: TetR family transcriptional regulator [Steroidobacteraceae bacterium]|nr:TetR family transcriptional regulator [Steroidobacteraceae bacterium]
MVSSKRPVALTREELYQRVWSKPITAVAAQLGVSGNALTKICDRLLVPYPPRGYWARRSGGALQPQPPLPRAPEEPAARVTISSERAASRRLRTRLSPQERREQLLLVAQNIIARQGLHAASMKQIASIAGISETQAYNYFGSREKLFAELARREFAHIRAARAVEEERNPDHYARITATTSAYLRLMSLRGGLLQTLLSSPEVRTLLRQEHHKRSSTEVHEHAQGLVDLYGIERAVALGCTVVLTTLCLRAGKLISDKRISLQSGERLCLSMVLQGSRDVVRSPPEPDARIQN